MGKKPLIACPQKAVFRGLCFKTLRHVSVGAPRERYHNTKAFRAVGAAGSVVKRCREDFHQSAGGDQECFAFRGVQEPFFNLILFGQKQNEIISTEIELTVPVILEAVQLRLSPQHQPSSVGIPPKQ